MSKIRNGFVSNSSSSSFIISGISLGDGDLARRLDISPEDAEESEIENTARLRDKGIRDATCLCRPNNECCRN